MKRIASFLIDIGFTAFGIHIDYGMFAGTI